MGEEKCNPKNLLSFHAAHEFNRPMQPWHYKSLYLLRLNNIYHCVPALTQVFICKHSSLTLLILRQSLTGNSSYFLWHFLLLQFKIHKSMQKKISKPNPKTFRREQTGTSNWRSKAKQWMPTWNMEMPRSLLIDRRWRFAVWVHG